MNDQLTDFEYIALSMRNDGATYKEISGTLSISQPTAYELVDRATRKNLIISIDAIGGFIDSFNKTNKYWELELKPKTEASPQPPEEAEQ